MIYLLKAICLNSVHRCAEVSPSLQKIFCIICRDAIFLACLTISLFSFAAEDRKSIAMNKGKSLGQIFTPKYLACDILDVAGYKSDNSILEKHVIDNSCGDGAFLKEIVTRYCRAAHNKGIDNDKLCKELETFIHGIELDKDAYANCLKNLNDLCSSFSLTNISWDIRCANTLDIDVYDNKMDYVVGNPPYIRVHNLDTNFNRVKQYRFCSGGMTDLYLVFYEIGLRMLKDNGRLCYIAPSSWFNSLAGKDMRSFIEESGWLREVIDLGHYQPFNATTYTAIVLFEKSKGDSFVYKTYSGAGKIRDVACYNFKECSFDNALYIGDKKSVALCRAIKTSYYPKYVDVKNGFATLADDIFIADDFPFNEMVIPVIKGSTGKWRNAFYPYDQRGKPLSRDIVFSNKRLAEYLESSKERLLKGRKELDVPEWYLYGRTQALKDVWVDKYAINTVVRDISSIKFNKVKSGEGVYSGLYILSDVPEEIIRNLIFSEGFIKYIRVLKKYKSGGYYTFSSKDLEQYLNFHLNKIIDLKTKCNNFSKQMTFEFKGESK